MNSRQFVDRVIEASWIIPVEPENTVFTDSVLVIDKGLIVGVFPAEVARQRFQTDHWETLSGQVLIPGLINLHTHSAMALMRGMADDMALTPWLTEKIWPTEQKIVSDEFVYDGTLLACQEMMRGGITCFNEMYFYPQAIARAVIDSGMRAMIGLTVMDMPTKTTTDAMDCLRQGECLLSSVQHERIGFCVAPHAPYTVGDEAFRAVYDFKTAHGLKVHLHLNETDWEVNQSIEQYGMRPAERLARLKLLDRDLIAVHAVSLNTQDIQMMSEAGVSVAHCPVSNLKLGSGIAPVAEMLANGMTVGLGTDGAASNNRLDLFQEMRFAALLAKGKTHDPSVAPAYTALKMATLNAAKALGLDDIIGSLTPGKRADICAVDLSRPEYLPCYDPVSHLVYVCGREAVTQVWVDGVPQLGVGILQQDMHKDLNKSISVWQNLVLR